MYRIATSIICLLWLWSTEVKGQNVPDQPTDRLNVTGVEALAYSPDGTLLAMAVGNGIRLYSTTPFTEVGFLGLPETRVLSIAFSPDGKTLASGNRNGTISLWDVQQGQKVKVLQRDLHQTTSVVFSPDGQTLASGGWEDAARLWDIRTGSERATLGDATKVIVNVVAFSPDGHTLLVGGKSRSRDVGEVMVWDVAQKGGTGLKGHTAIVRAVAFSPDGQLFASGSGDRTVRLWNMKEERVTVLTSENLVNSLAFSPDGKFLAWGSGDRTVRVWSTGRQQQVAILKGYRGQVLSVVFRPDGQVLASGGGDGIWLWDVSSTMREDHPTDAQLAVEQESIEQVSLGSLPPPPGAALVVEIERASTPLTIDGSLDDWLGIRHIMPFTEGGPHISIEPAYALRDDGRTEPEGTARTPADLSGVFALQWDDEWIYLAAWVTDNVHDITGTETWKWWLKDSVSLFVDVPLDGDGPRWITGDHDVSFVADPTHPEGRIWWRHGDAQGHQEVPAPQELRMGVQLNTSGYTFEGAIPMALLASLTPDWQPPFEERSVGFMFLVTDPDGGPDPFGGELIYGGDDDNDAKWARLRFVSAGAATPPRFEAPIPDDPARRTADSRIVELLQKLILPPGFRANLFASVPNGPNRMTVGPDGRLYVTVGGWGPGGKVWVLEDADGDGMAEKRKAFIDGLNTPLGMAFRGTDLYVTHRTGGSGRVSRYRDTNGDDQGEWVKDIVRGLSQGHGVGNVLLGPDDRLYIGQGSAGDVQAGSSPLDATIFRVDPDGQNLTVVATGLRNPYGFAFDRQGRLFATDNGPDHVAVPHHDELNYIVEGREYGFPRVYLSPDDTGESMPPIWRFAEHASANGMTFYTGSSFPSEYQDNAFVAIWGPADPNHVDLENEPRPPWDAYYVARVELADTVVTRVSRFAGDFQHPNDVMVGPGGVLFIADWGSTGPNGAQNQADGDGAMYRIVYEGGPIVTNVAGEEGQRVLPEGFSLTGAPNPFNSATILSYAAPVEGNVTLLVYNVQGQAVRTLVQGWTQKGYARVVWDGRDDTGREVGSGFYIVRLASDTGTTRIWKTLLLR